MFTSRAKEVVFQQLLRSQVNTASRGNHVKLEIFIQCKSKKHMCELNQFPPQFKHSQHTDNQKPREIISSLSHLQ